MIRKAGGFVCLLVVCVLSGCAFTTESINIQYSQQQSVGLVNGADGVVVDVKVIDQRPDKTKVGSKKNGYGMETAPIIANEDVVATLKKAIEQELLARGFKVGAEAAIVQINADLTRFYNEYKMGFWTVDAIADLNLYVIVKNASGGQLFSRQIVAQGLEPNNQYMGGENAQRALNRALENGMKMLFEDSNFLSALVAASAPKAAAL